MLQKKQLYPVCREFIQLVTSKPFCLLLSHMTELELVNNLIKSDNAENGVSGCSSESNGTSSQYLATNTDGQNSTPSNVKSSVSDNHSDSVELTSSALCCSSVNCWHSGSYTLAGDPSDPGLGKFCLEIFLHFNCEGKALCTRTCMYVAGK